MSTARLLEPRIACLLLAAASAALLLGALGLEYLGGLPPCQLCVWQRWPHLAVVGLGLLGVLWRPRPMLALAALTLLGNAGLAGYHVGIEQGLWALPAGCVAGAEAGSVEELRALLEEAQPACDQVTFTLLGLSLAAWNGLLCLALGGYGLGALRAGRAGGLPLQTAKRPS